MDRPGGDSERGQPPIPEAGGRRERAIANLEARRLRAPGVTVEELLSARDEGRPGPGGGANG